MRKRKLTTYQANWDTVATAMGYKDASIAKTRWSQIRKKKIGGATANAGVTKHRAPNKKTTTKKAVSDNEDDEDSKPIKPATKGKGKGKAVKSATKIKDEDENNGDATEAWVAAQADQAEPGDEFGALPTADSQA